MSKETGKHFNLIFRLVCFLLVVTSFTCVAFARYISVRSTPGGMEIGGVRGSISVERATSGSGFYNSEYIIGTSVMNQPYMTDFTLSNCNRDESGALIKNDPAQVDLACEVVLYIPKELAAVAAFQISSVEVTEEGLTVSETQVTPIYTVADFLSATDAVTMPKHTGSAEKPYENYGMMLQLNADGNPTISETFSVQKGTTEDRLVLQANQTDGAKNVMLSIEEEVLNVNMSYTFQCFDKEFIVENLPQLRNPLFAQCEQTATFYKMRLAHPGFILKGGKEHTTVYRLRLIPTKQLGNFGESDTAQEMNMPFSVWRTEKESLDPQPKFTYNGAEITSFNADGSFTVPLIGGTTENVYPNTCIAKDFPMRVNAIFTQTSTAQSPKGETE